MQNKKRHHSHRQPLNVILIIILLIIIFFLLRQVSIFYQTHFYPHTTLNGVNLDSLTFIQASQKLQSFQINPQAKIILIADDEKVSSSSSQLNLNYDFDNTLQIILQKQQSSPFIFNLLTTYFNPATAQFTAPINFNSNQLEAMVTILASRVNQSGKAGYLLLETSGDPSSLIIEKGQDEISLDQVMAYQIVAKQLGKQFEFYLPVNYHQMSLSSSQMERLTVQAQQLINKSIDLTTDQVDNFTFTIDDTFLIPLLGATSSTKLSLSQDLFQTLSTAVERPAQEPELIIDQNTREVLSFIPPLNGLKLDQNELLTAIDQQINLFTATNSAEKTAISLPLIVTQPTMSLSETNDLGINDLIGFGESYYDHSISGRIHNVALTSSKLNNTLVAPGQEFSFNQTIGEVSAATGYQNGYVIQGGRSVLSPGGGVCQVSTTLFRALLDAGLQITLRHPHSYRVSYYELNNDPGFDATVYSGNIDLRFINDTDHYLLISSQTDNDNLYMTVKIYGYDDGRYTTITDYKKYNFVGAPATEYIVDASLPSGTKKQIDWAVGGLQTIFTHTIYNGDNSIRSQTKYPSKYQAWSAKFLVGP